MELKTFEEIKNYVEKGIKPSNFISAIIENDLKMAVGCANHININFIPNYVEFFYKYTPTKCWGYKGAIKNWIEYLEYKKKVVKLERR